VLDLARIPNMDVAHLPDTPYTVLWSGGYYMAAGQTATLSQSVTAQKNGIILVWSAYSGGVPQDYAWTFDYVPRWYVERFPGAGTQCLASSTNSNPPTLALKYVYVSNTTINGNALNDTAPGNSRVLRYVLGY
jgi:hypothetical protein